ncbi:MAG: GlxA family transcriptional regulator [Alphaproteobacteria bacterium]|nr:GlxA family transcriptional regulator [Alphaproteobacteria bacterium]MDA7989184.1 GlxA family transcriptional regulator [Alphaproteobacteria bacterium]
MTQMTQNFGFLLLPNFSLGAFAAAIEPLRLVNRATHSQNFNWKCFSINGEPATSSTGVTIPVSGSLNHAENSNTLILVGGENITQLKNNELLRWLHRLDRSHTQLGAICTGPWILAAAGLLEDEVATIHWENLDAFMETFPKVKVSADLFEIKGKYLTCAGGFAAADMMLALIARSQPDEIVIAAADQLIQERIRTNSDSQHLAATQRLGARHPRLLQIVRRMEENLETPLTREELVADLDISTRQMERLFRKYLHKTPDRYYLDLRLDRARHMLLQTQMRVLEVALACGFVSASHFSRCYRDRFNRTPRNERGLPPPENKKTARH